MNSISSTPGLLWLLLTTVCIVTLLYGLKKGLEKTNWPASKSKKIFWGAAIIFSAWIALLGILATNGFFADFSKLPPGPVLAMMIPLPFALTFTFSKMGTQLLRSIPPQWIVFFHSFRIFVELLIWLAFISNKLPIQMTFEGRNFDVLTGILALPVAYWIIKRKSLSPKVIVAFNIVGLLLLLNILIVAVLSMPVSFQYFTNGPSAAMVAQFPFILLPGVLVPFAYSFHIFSLRQLYIKKQDSRIFA